MRRRSTETVEVSIRCLRKSMQGAYCFDIGELDEDGAPKFVWIGGSLVTELGGDRYEIQQWIVEKEGLECFVV